MSTDPIAIDLSHHNTVSSFTSVAADDVIAVIHKATEGTTYVDDQYASRRKAALDAGLAFCSYHFLKHGDVEAQIEHYLRTAKPGAGERVVIDHEDEAVTLDDLTDAVRCILDLDPTLQITVYSGHTIKDQIHGNDCVQILADTTSLWIAQYTSASSPSWPTGTWPTWSLWQYSDKGSVSGISGPCDVNRFNGSDDNAAKWFAPATDQPAPGPTPQPQPEQAPILVDIVCPPGSNIVITINGDTITPG